MNSLDSETKNTPTSTTALNILVIEDDEIDRESVKRFVVKKKFNYQLDFADSVNSARAKLMVKSYDLMLVDYLLGDGTGIEILKEFGEHTPAIFVTGNGDEKVAVEAIQEGAYDYIIKDSARNYLEIVELTVNKVLRRKQAEKDLAEKTLLLERSNKDLEQFAYVVSHDLNEPLRTVKSFVEILSTRYSDNLDETALEFMGFISEGCTRMQALIASLLEYSRTCSKEMPFAVHNSKKILEDSLKNLQVKINELGVKVSYPEKMPDININDVYVKQVFQNLIANGIKFCTSKPEIKISFEDLNNGFIKFTVGDNGIGIKPEHQERIFMVFQRLHTREEYEGSGIGLSICKKTVERHGGEIWLDSEYGVGTNFHFTLPKA